MRNAYQALYLAFVPQAAEPDHPIVGVILGGDPFASVGAIDGAFPRMGNRYSLDDRWRRSVDSAVNTRASRGAMPPSTIERPADDRQRDQES